MHAATQCPTAILTMHAAPIIQAGPHPLSWEAHISFHCARVHSRTRVRAFYALICCRHFSLQVMTPRPGSVVVERSPGIREVGGSIPGRVKQKTLKFEVLLLWLALSTKGLETVWPARSQNNGLDWNITAYPRGGVSVG